MPSDPDRASAPRVGVWLTLLLLGLVAAACGGEAGLVPREALPSRPPGPPNVVLILADDLDFDELGVAGYADPERFPSFTGHLARRDTSREVSPYWGYGDARMHTPRLDALAQEGALFERFYVTTPLCNPSRYSLLTGQQATRSSELLRHQPAGGPAMLDFNAYLTPGDFTLARALGAAGYVTGMVGKWDLTPREAPDCGAVAGLDPQANARDPGVAAVLAESYERGRRSVLERGGFREADRVYAFNKEAMGLPLELQQHNLEWIVEGALEFIEAHRDEPFFLHVAPTVPHGWLDARVADEDPRATPRGWLDEAPRGMPPRARLPARLAELGVDKRSLMATWLDDAVGAILDRLDALGLAGDTLVIFTSDHQNRGKGALYEGARVPMLLRWPGRVRPGTRVPEVCGNVDVVPTLLEACGASAPDGVPLDGRSFLPLVEGRPARGRPGSPSGETADAWREGLLLQVHHARAVVTEQWKLIAVRHPPELQAQIDADVAARGPQALRDYGWDGVARRDVNGHAFITYAADDIFPGFFAADQLYDLAADPYEQRNLFGVERFAAAYEHLTGLLAEQLAPLPHGFGADRRP